MFVIDTQPDKITASRNFISLQTKSYSTWSSNASYLIQVEILYEPEYRSGLFETLTTLNQQPDSKGKCTFLLEYFLDTIVEVESPNISGLQFLYICNQICRRYKLLVREVVNGVNQNEITTDIKHVVKAGLNRKNQQSLQQIADNRQWLTIQPEDKESHEIQHEFLSYIIPSGISGIRIRGNAYNSQGISTPFPVAPAFPVQEYDVVRLSVGSPMFVIPDTVRWDIWLDLTTNERITPIQKYHIPNQYSAYKHQYLWLNRFGGYDTAVFTGTIRQATQTESRSLQTIGQWLRELRQYNTSYQEGFEQNSHYLTEKEIDWVSGLLTSEDVHREKEGRFLPINIDRGNTSIKEDNVFPQKIRFTFKEAYKNP